MRRLSNLAKTSVMALVALGAFQAKAAMVEIKIQNLTSGQIFSPAAVVVHKSSFELFQVGQPAQAAVYMIAEDGATEAAKALESRADVQSVVVGPPIMPGKAGTVRVAVPMGYKISFVSMLASTNDGFYGVNGLAVPARGSYVERMVPAYDAGSEQNNESCAYVPGPPCSAHGVRMTQGSEGFVSVHNGIHGIADLSPTLLDWNNPVAHVTVRQID
jgi:hypothetical protein